MFAKRFCRLCLWNDPKLVHLYQENERKEDSLLHKIEYCLGTKVSKDGNQSRYVCPKCAHKIDLFYVFKTNCKRADNLQKTSKEGLPHKEKARICSSKENSRFGSGSEKRLSAAADEQFNEEFQHPNQMQLSDSQSVSKNYSSQGIIETEQCKSTSNNCCVLTGVDHFYDTNKECVLEEIVFPTEDLTRPDESATASEYNTSSSDYGTLESETRSLKYIDSSNALVAENDENQRNINNILSKSFHLKCTSRVYSNEVMRTTSQITQHTVQKEVFNNSLNVSNNLRVSQSSMLNANINELTNYYNGACNVLYLTGLNENGDSNNLLVHSDKVFYTSAILYDAFLHDLPLQTVLEGSTFVPPFSSSFMRCSYCEKLFRCMRSHVMHKSVCQKFFQCRYCRKKFVSKILRQLHHLNECAFRRICHDHGYAQGQGHKVTEKTLMKMAKVCLHKLHICTKCNNIFRTEDHLIIHKTTCQREVNQSRSPLRVSRTRQSLRCLENKTLQNLNMHPVNSLKKECSIEDVKNKSSITNAGRNNFMLRNSNLSVKTRSAASVQSKPNVKRKDISDGTSVLYAVGLVKKN